MGVGGRSGGRGRTPDRPHTQCTDLRGARSHGPKITIQATIKSQKLNQLSHAGRNPTEAGARPQGLQNAPQQPRSALSPRASPLIPASKQNITMAKDLTLT